MKKNAYIYNPTCDMAVAKNNPHYMPSATLQMFEQNLACIMAFMCNENDCVIVPQLPSSDYCNFLTKMMGFCPEFILSDQFDNQIHHIEPWGWSPAIHKKYIGKIWNPLYRNLFSRNTGYKFIELCCFDSDRIIEPNVAVAYSMNEVFAYLDQWTQIVVKSPWSSSGRGVVFLNCKDDVAGLQWIGGFIATQGSVFIESQYEKIQDFSFLFNKQDETISYVGYSYFLTSNRKDYVGHIVGNTNSESIQGLIQHRLTLQDIEMLIAVYENVLQEIDFIDYNGFVGIDGMIVLVGGNIKIMPVCELNVRTTMGVLALKISDYLNKNSCGKMNITKNTSKYYEGDKYTNQLNFINEGRMTGEISLLPRQDNERFGVSIVI